MYTSDYSTVESSLLLWEDQRRAGLGLFFANIRLTLAAMESDNDKIRFSESESFQRWPQKLSNKGGGGGGCGIPL